MRPAATGRLTLSSPHSGSTVWERPRSSTVRSTSRRSSLMSSECSCRRSARAMSSCSTIWRCTSSPRSERPSNRSAPRSAFCRLYSPDFNPIELALAKLKAFLRAMRPRTFEQVCALIAAALGPLYVRRMRQLRPPLRLPSCYALMENARRRSSTPCRAGGDVHLAPQPSSAQRSCTHPDPPRVQGREPDSERNDGSALP